MKSSFPTCGLNVLRITMLFVIDLGAIGTLRFRDEA
jgi:hypothetical protein